MTRPPSFRIAAQDETSEPEVRPYRYRGLVIVGAIVAVWVPGVLVTWGAAQAWKALASAVQP